MVTFNRLWCIVILINICEASLTLCDLPQSNIEMEEGKQNNTYICSGLKQAESVQWYLEYPQQPNQPIFIGVCLSNLSCSVQLKAIFNLSRTTETSVITVNDSAVLNKNTFSTATLLCRTFLQELKTDETRCQVDYIYPAENIFCNIEFSGDTWRLAGQCAISKAYSTRNNYGCYLYQTLEGSQESTRVGFYSMDLGPSTANKFVSGTCNLTSFLPPDGRYTYTVIILPGKVKVPATFNGNNAIRQPPVSPVHNCPLFVNEGDTVNCKCSVADAGLPPGKLAWNTSSDQLLLTGVKKEQHGMTYVCGVTWNNTISQPVTYTLLVSRPPSQLSFQLNNITSDMVTVEEKSPVTMFCQSDGRPTPTMTITYVTNGNRVLQSLQGGIVSLAHQQIEKKHTLVSVQCQDSGEYRCSAYNAVGSQNQSVKLFVRCAPRRSPADLNASPPTIEEGKTASFELNAYPFVNISSYFLGPNIISNETLTSKGVFCVDCSAHLQLIYRILCTVTVISVKSDTTGFYKLFFSNEVGSVAFVFQVLHRTTDSSTSSEFSRGLGVGLGIAAAVVVVCALVVYVFFWQRKRRTSRGKDEGPNIAYSLPQNIKAEGRLNSQDSDAYETVHISEGGQTPAHHNVPGGDKCSRAQTHKQAKVYDALHPQEVGVRSPYASLT